MTDQEADLENPQDTIELISYAHSQSTRENSPIKNVVLDLSCNIGRAVFIISGTRQISTVKNGSFYNIDPGVEPDFVLFKAESFLRS